MVIGQRLVVPLAVWINDPLTRIREAAHPLEPDCPDDENVLDVVAETGEELVEDRLLEVADCAPILNTEFAVFPGWVNTDFPVIFGEQLSTMSLSSTRT